MGEVKQGSRVRVVRLLEPVSSEDSSFLQPNPLFRMCDAVLRSREFGVKGSVVRVCNLGDYTSVLVHHIGTEIYAPYDLRELILIE